ncbi:recombinase domain protein [Brucella lupini]|uniref:Recombinase domain protein n=1 Tax=Brucella lupini TaxID=255457 RepID=A0A256GZK9_9HYPH|nr:recombinase domain protein [Brucella lupini]
MLGDVDGMKTLKIAFHRLISSSFAREHSCVLSTRVHMGQTTFIKKGFRQGDPSGFGLRSFLIDDAGNPKS